MNIYLVEDVGNNPGRIYGCFADASDAQAFVKHIEREFNTECVVSERVLHYGQPPYIGVV